MKNRLVAMAAVAIALSAGFAIAQKANEPSAPNVVRGETIMVKPAVWGTTMGFYMNEKDRALVNEAVRAIDSDQATKKAFVTVMANNGVLTVAGVADVAQGARIDMKLKALRGGTKVVSIYDSQPGGAE